MMMGQRDELYRRKIGVPSIAERVRLHSVEELHRDAADLGRQAAAHATRKAPGWWLHIDLDVLEGKKFNACGAAADASMLGGLTWVELGTVTKAVFETGGCSGWSIGVYNTDLDPERQAAKRIISFVADVTSSWS